MTPSTTAERLEKKSEEVKKVIKFDGEKDLSVKAKLAGVEITLLDKRGELLAADTKGKVFSFGTVAIMKLNDPFMMHCRT